MLAFQLSNSYTGDILGILLRSNLTIFIFISLTSFINDFLIPKSNEEIGVRKKQKKKAKKVCIRNKSVGEK